MYNNLDRQFYIISQYLKVYRKQAWPVAAALVFLLSVMFLGCVIVFLCLGSGRIHFPGILLVVGGILGIRLLADYCDSRI